MCVTSGSPGDDVHRTALDWMHEATWRDLWTQDEESVLENTGRVHISVTRAYTKQGNGNLAIGLEQGGRKGLQDDRSLL